MIIHKTKAFKPILDVIPLQPLVTDLIYWQPWNGRGSSGVRYIGIDAPELGQAANYEDRLVNAELAKGKVVELEKDVSETGRDGRLLRYV